MWSLDTLDRLNAAQEARERRARAIPYAEGAAAALAALDAALDPGARAVDRELLTAALERARATLRSARDSSR